MPNDLYITIPEDFNEKYLNYKDRILGIENKDQYSTRKEDFNLANLGIEIKEEYIFKGDNKFKINSTDRKLIDFLHYRFQEEKGMRSNINIIANELGKKEKYIKNRISIINMGVKKLILGKGKTSIDSFIKYEQERGYYINPRFVITFPKQK